MRINKLCRFQVLFQPFDVIPYPLLYIISTLLLNFPISSLHNSPSDLASEKEIIMFTTRRAWSCAIACDPISPCNGPGCPNARYPRPYYNPGFWPRPNYLAGPNPYHNTNPPLFWTIRAPPRPPPPPPPPPRPPPRLQSHGGSSGHDGTVRIGVGNVSNTDIEIDVQDNVVMGGRRRVDIGSGNFAGGSNMGVIANNRADADDLMIGSDNYSKFGDNKIRVTNTDLSGFGRVNIGSGNYARNGNRIVVDLLGSDNGDRPGRSAQGGQQRRRWWLF